MKKLEQQKCSVSSHRIGSFHRVAGAFTLAIALGTMAVAQDSFRHRTPRAPFAGRIEHAVPVQRDDAAAAAQACLQS